MVRKSKRKQTVIPFERSSDAVVIDLTLCTAFLCTDENETDAFTVSAVLKSLAECQSILQQTKVLQENKSYFKKIIGKVEENNEFYVRSMKNVFKLKEYLLIISRPRLVINQFYSMLTAWRLR